MDHQRPSRTKSKTRGTQRACAEAGAALTLKLQRELLAGCGLVRLEQLVALRVQPLLLLGPLLLRRAQLRPPNRALSIRQSAGDCA